MAINFSSYYGVFDANMNPVEVIDVSNKTEALVKDVFLILPKEHSLDDLFPNDFIGIKYLQVQLPGGKRINILNDTYAYDVSINLGNHDNQIVIVYYVFINANSNWQAIISGQLRDIKSYGLLDEADLYIHITNVHLIEGVLAFIKKQTDHKAIISQSFANQFEYPALNLLQELSKKQPDKTYMYFHTKGMSQNIPKRNGDEQLLLSGTFKHWRQHIEAFQNPAIHKLGLFPAREAPDWGGWIWYNFFIVKGTYLAECSSLILSADRYYYESWLARFRSTISVDDCYSLHTKKRENFSQVQTVAFMGQLLAKHSGKTKSRKISLRLRYPFIKIKR